MSNGRPLGTARTVVAEGSLTLCSKHLSQVQSSRHQFKWCSWNHSQVRFQLQLLPISQNRGIAHAPSYVQITIYRYVVLVPDIPSGINMTLKSKIGLPCAKAKTLKTHIKAFQTHGREASCITFVLVRNEWSASRSGCFIHGETVSLTHWLGGWTSPKVMCHFPSQSLRWLGYWSSGGWKRKN